MDAGPYDIHYLEASVNEKLVSLFTGQKDGFASFGPKKYIFPQQYKEVAEDIYNLEIRPDDTFVITFPRSGTTWTQELVWLIQNDLDYDTANTVGIGRRWPFLEFSIFSDPKTIDEYRQENKDNAPLQQLYDRMSEPAVPLVNALPSPRFIKTHLPFSMLPENLFDAKVVYVVRDPRDAAVSFYHHNRLIRNHNYIGDFKTYWELFRNDLIIFTPYFECLKEAWEKRNHPNMLFLYYEDMVQDFPEAIRKVATFFGKDLSDDQVQKLAEYLKFDNFKNNTSVNLKNMEVAGILNKGEQPFIRKGKSGAWREYFDEEMTAQAEEWIKHNLKDTDIVLRST